MDTFGSKCKSLDDNLPSSEFDKQFRQSINLDTLENAALYKENKVNIVNWLQNFTTQFSHYYNKESVKWHKNIHGKRCRDLNYYVDYIIDLISELEFKGNRGKRVKASKTEIDTVKQSMKSLFKHSDKFKCDREEEDYVKRIPIKKDLDDFCENRDYLYGYLDNSNKDCDRLTTYVKEKYDFFFNENTCILDPNNGNEKPLKINDNCTLYDIPKTFSYGHCSNDEMPHRIKSIPHCPAAETFTFGKFLQYISDYMQYIPGISFIQDNLLYVGIGVGGALTLFFVIYKFSPLGYFYRRRKKKNQEINDMMHGYTAPLGNNLFYGMPPTMQNMPHGMLPPMQNVPYRMPTPMQNMQYRMPLPMQNMPYRMLPPTQNMQYRMAYQAE